MKALHRIGTRDLLVSVATGQHGQPTLALLPEYMVIIQCHIPELLLCPIAQGLQPVHTITARADAACKHETLYLHRRQRQTKVCHYCVWGMAMSYQRSGPPASMRDALLVQQARAFLLAKHMAGKTCSLCMWQHGHTFPARQARCISSARLKHLLSISRLPACSIQHDTCFGGSGVLSPIACASTCHLVVHHG